MPTPSNRATDLRDSPAVRHDGCDVFPHISVTVVNDNAPRFAIVSGINAVCGDWNPYLDLPADVSALELGLVVGPISRMSTT